MQKSIFRLLAVCATAAIMCNSADAEGWRARLEVQGVEEGDMLKMRMGPGTGFNVVVGLPNGTIVRVHSCQQTGGTRWCKVGLDQAPGLRGYVSRAYLRER